MNWGVTDVLNIVIYAGGLAGALGSIALVGRFVVVSPLKKWLREQIAVPMLETRDTANMVRSEVRPDHGQSMRDVVDRTEIQVARTAQQLDTLTHRFQDHLNHHPS